MRGAVRPHRVQKEACRQAVAAVLGPAAAAEVMRRTGIANLPDHLPAGPRDLQALAGELQPFVDLYREVRARATEEAGVAVARRAIIQSAVAGFASSADTLHREVATDDPQTDAGLDLTSPPPPGFAAAQEELDRRFEVSMQFFSCRGRLFEYTPDRVQFHITACNWVRAMEEAGAPELIPFFCEADERFMDGHPTHRLVRPTAIGLGDAYCDFQFVRKDHAGEIPSRRTGQNGAR